MAVVVETTLGDLTVDLFIHQRPRACLNFLKLCKRKYYNYNLFHTIQHGFIAQTGDPSGEGSGGHSVWGLLDGVDKRYFQPETNPKLKHDEPGTLSMVTTDDGMVASQFFFTLSSNLNSLDSRHCIIGQVTEGLDTLRLINETICDTEHRPYQDVRITHTVILEDPFEDPQGFKEPSRSPSPSAERLAGGRIAPDEEIDETKGKTEEELAEMVQEREAKARATILEIVGDLPDAEVAPPENVLFVCKLNPVTTDDDLEIIFSRFGTIKCCEVIRDRKTGDSLQYAFIEFEDKKSCEDAYFKMDNVLIDDRRIHVDFSQSVSQLKWRGKGKGVIHMNDVKHEDLKCFTGRSPDTERSRDHQKRTYSNNKNRNNDNNEFDSRHSRNNERKDGRQSRERHREIKNRNYANDNNDRHRSDQRNLKYDTVKNDSSDKSREMKQSPNDKYGDRSLDRTRYRERRDDRPPENYRNKSFEQSNYRTPGRRDFDRRRNKSPERRRERSHEKTRNKSPENVRGRKLDSSNGKYAERKERDNEPRSRNREKENFTDDNLRDVAKRGDDKHYKQKSHDSKYKSRNNCSKNGSETPTGSPKHKSSRVPEINNSKNEKFERAQTIEKAKDIQKSSTKKDVKDKKRKRKAESTEEESSDDCSPSKKRKRTSKEVKQKSAKNSTKKKQDGSDSVSSEIDDEDSKKSKNRKKTSKSKITKKKKKYSSSSSESSSSSSSDSSDESSESSSDSAPKKKKSKKNTTSNKYTNAKKNKKVSESSSSSSSSESDSSSSSSDSSDSGHEQSRKKSKNKKSVREKSSKKKDKK